MSTRARLIALVTLIALAGCECGDSEAIAQAYHKELASEPGMQDIADVVAQRQDGGLPVHFQMSLRMSTLGRLGAWALETILGQRLGARTTAADVKMGDHRSTIRLVGKPGQIALKPGGDCPECLRLLGDIDARVELDLPMLGRTSVPMRGKFDTSVPMRVQRDDKGAVALWLDLGELGKQGSRALEAELGSMPPQIQGLVRETILRRANEAIASHLQPIEIVGIPTRALGLDDLELVPTRLSLDPKQGSITLGLMSNLPRASHGLRALDAPPAQSDISFAAHPEAVLRAAQLLLQRKAMTRRSDLDGQRADDGSARVTLRKLLIKEPRGDQQRLELAFRIWNFGDTSASFWADATAHIGLTYDKGVLRSSVDKVDILETSNPMASSLLGDWNAAPLLSEFTDLLKRAAAVPVLRVPGTRLGATMSAVHADARGIVVSATLTIARP